MPSRAAPAAIVETRRGTEFMAEGGGDEWIPSDR